LAQAILALDCTPVDGAMAANGERRRRRDVLLGVLRVGGAPGGDCALNVVTPKQLLELPGALPFYEESPPCPTCGHGADAMESLEGSEVLVCSWCSEGVVGRACPSSGAVVEEALPAHSCRLCGSVLCAACNQTLRVQRSMQDVRTEAAAEEAPAEAQAAAAIHALTVTRAELTVAIAQGAQGKAMAASAATTIGADVARLRAVAAKERAQLGHRAAAVRSELACQSDELREVEAEVSSEEVELAQLLQAASEAEEEAARRFECGAESPEEQAAARTAALAAEVCEAAAEADAASASGAIAQAAAAAAGLRAAQLRAECAALRNEEALCATSDTQAILEARARLHAVRDAARRPAPPAPPVLEPVPAQAMAAPPAQAAPRPRPQGLRGLWSRVKEIARDLDLSPPDPAPAAQTAPSTSSCSGGGGGGGTGAVGAPGAAATSNEALRSMVEVWQERTNRELQRMNEVHDRLSGCTADADRLRTEAERLRGLIRAESARRGHLRAELGTAHAQASRRKAAIQAELEAEFRGYHEQVLAALGELPPLSAMQAEAAEQGSALEAFGQRLSEIEARLGFDRGWTVPTALSKPVHSSSASDGADGPSAVVFSGIESFIGPSPSMEATSAS